LAITAIAISTSSTRTPAASGQSVSALVLAAGRRTGRRVDPATAARVSGHASAGAAIAGDHRVGLLNDRGAHHAGVGAARDAAGRGLGEHAGSGALPWRVPGGQWPAAALLDEHWDELAPPAAFLAAVVGAVHGSLDVIDGQLRELAGQPCGDSPDRLIVGPGVT
jgi:hypothetical protein